MYTISAFLPVTLLEYPKMGKKGSIGILYFPSKKFKKPWFLIIRNTFYSIIKMEIEAVVSRKMSVRIWLFVNVIEKSVIEVEAGRGLLNNQFLKDLFQACLMQDVDYLTIAVLREYKTKNRITKDFEEICRFFDALYSSERLKLPLKGILIIGYETPKI